ncbi:hypothetical protein NAI72_12545, partial [Francisella tularensis subsp. holarctica]|uniref:helix-hairpin-helix domain-containing protein n=1 Tax=Francisella tularensis TaxID=263 RepID=UPI002381BF14
IFDLCRRDDLRKVKKKALEALCYAGAIKDISKNRATAFNSLEKAIKNAGYVNELNAAGPEEVCGFTGQESETEADL